MKYYLALSLPNPNPSAADIIVKAPAGVPTTGDILGNTPQFILTVIIVFVLVAAVAMIVYSGIQWITSGGDPKKIEGARGRLTYSIVGLVVALLATLIVGMTINLLGGSPGLFNISFFNKNTSIGVGAQPGAGVQGTGNLPTPGPKCTPIKEALGIGGC